MRILAISAAVLAVALAMSDVAAAQGRPAGAGAAPRAPVGHRQPGAKDMPPEGGTAPVEQTKEDRALERALKGICRGC